MPHTDFFYEVSPGFYCAQWSLAVRKEQPILHEGGGVRCLLSEYQTFQPQRQRTHHHSVRCEGDIKLPYQITMAGRMWRLRHSRNQSLRINWEEWNLSHQNSCYKDALRKIYWLEPFRKRSNVFVNEVWSITIQFWNEHTYIYGPKSSRDAIICRWTEKFCFVGISSVFSWSWKYSIW